MKGFFCGFTLPWRGCAQNPHHGTYRRYDFWPHYPTSTLILIFNFFFSDFVRWRFNYPTNSRRDESASRMFGALVWEAVE
jgi:hypothetical protein